MTAPAREQPLVSVATPVYNGAEYLAESIESVINQTYQNWEYVIVDNCSTDATLEIARGYEANDQRIRVVAADVFVGPIENQNRAVQEIAPESMYTKVLHADDWLFPECLERMVDLAESNPTVGIVSAYRLEETRVTLDGLPHSISVLPGREIARSTLLANPYPFLFGSPSSVLIRSDLIRARDPFYNDDNPWDEDTEACLESLKVSDFGFVHQVLTFSRRPEGSLFSQHTRLGAYLPGEIKLLEKFGRTFLTEAEYERRLAVLLTWYGIFFLTNIRKLGDPDFRSYQRTALREVVPAINLRDLLAGVRLQLLRMRETGRIRSRGS